MAYNEERAERIRTVLRDKNIFFEEKKMFGGICFMVEDKMCCGTHTDKKYKEELLLCRIGEDEYENALTCDNVIPMEFTGKPMKGYVFVKEEGCKSYKDLAHWIQLCLNYNPKAKKSAKK